MAASSSAWVSGSARHSRIPARIPSCMSVRSSVEQRRTNPHPAAPRVSDGISGGRCSMPRASMMKTSPGAAFLRLAADSFSHTTVRLGCFSSLSRLASSLPTTMTFTSVLQTYCCFFFTGGGVFGFSPSFTGGASTRPPPPLSSEPMPCPGRNRFGFTGRRRHLVRLQRAYQLRCDEHHQLGLLLLIGLALEQVADDRDAAQEWDRRPVFLRRVLEQAGDRERLAVAQFHVCLRAPGDQRRDSETLQA